MKNYPLAPLLRVRELREAEAAKIKKAMETALSMAVEIELKKETELLSFRKYRNEETERRYAQIIGKNLSQGELDSFRSGLALLAQRELSLEEELQELREKTKKARLGLQKAEENLRAALKSKEKLIRHRELFLTAEKALEIGKEELELEEFQRAPFEE